MRPTQKRIARAITQGWGLVALMVATATGAQGQETAATAPATFPLWPDGLPATTSPGSGPPPTLTLYRPPAARATGAAVVVCPGGGYQTLADHEGKPIAEWLNGLGITAVVLRYRLGPLNHHPAMLQDAAQAIRTTRAKANDWGVDPGRVAIIGFSAEGHLASTVGTHFDAGNPDAANPIDRQSSRPDRLLLIYPVISLREGITHAGSRRNLLGADPAPDLIDSLSNETQVRADTPPTFLVHTADDAVVNAEHSMLFALALQRAKVPVELHVFEHGRHGLGLARGGDLPYAEWTGLCERWLGGQGFLKAQP